MFINILDITRRYTLDIMVHCSLYKNSVFKNLISDNIISRNLVLYLVSTIWDLFFLETDMQHCQIMQPVNKFLYL